MSVYFSSDFHLGHKSILKYRDMFKDIEEHDNLIFDSISKLNKRDILFILGDFIFDGDDYQYYVGIINKMSCRIKVVMGNHDSLRLHNDFDIQLPLFSYKNNWVSHCPIHPQEMRNRFGNIHGHLHHNIIDDDRYFNVCLERNDYNFVNAELIRDKLGRRDGKE